MRSHSEIVRGAGDVKTVAEACRVSVHTVRSWIGRDSVPAEHWARFASDGWATLDELALSAAKKRAA